MQREKHVIESDGILSILLSVLFLLPMVLEFIIIYSFNLDPVLVQEMKHINSTVKIHVITSKTLLSTFFITLKIGYNTIKYISMYKF